MVIPTDVDKQIRRLQNIIIGLLDILISCYLTNHWNLDNYMEGYYPYSIAMHSYALIKKRSFPSVKIGGRYYVIESKVEEWLVNQSRMRS